ncbi:conserved hypothetical protein [Brucella melitensis M5-90]|uniref:Uncharacterized protein n=1 Tax=Brucella suis (strain ATCC 23445 / NCTC 10510) TaxID=470137 RepID=B0CLF7_BRUSI|nr:Hypothetical protein BSUIS_A0869 [Brucella suis ATCC 23445]ADZ86783.1 conserved hypothetical protein [Brucella melitensis M5-90]
MTTTAVSMFRDISIESVHGASRTIEDIAGLERVLI